MITNEKSQAIEQIARAGNTIASKLNQAIASNPLQMQRIMQNIGDGTESSILAINCHLDPIFVACSVVVAFRKVSALGRSNVPVDKGKVMIIHLSAQEKNGDYKKEVEITIQDFLNDKRLVFTEQEFDQPLVDLALLLQSEETLLQLPNE